MSPCEYSPRFLFHLLFFLPGARHPHQTRHQKSSEYIFQPYKQCSLLPAKAGQKRRRLRRRFVVAVLRWLAVVLLCSSSFTPHVRFPCLGRGGARRWRRPRGQRRLRTTNASASSSSSSSVRGSRCFGGSVWSVVNVGQAFGAVDLVCASAQTSR